MEKKNGFTLIEILIAMAIFGIVMTGIYQTFQFQQRSYLKQEQVADLQQNLRAGAYFLTRDIKMAGYDPDENADPTILKANAAEFDFEVDEDGSGVIGDGPRETIQYTLSADADKDGIADAFPSSLGRQYNNAGGFQPVADNIEALEFCYILADGTETLAPADPSEIRAVFVSMLARSANTIKGYTNTIVYTQASNDTTLTPNLAVRPAVWGPFNDHYKRKLSIVKIRCRNMGLDPYAI